VIFRHSIPILEYDNDPKAVIMHDQEDVVLPHRAVFAFLGDPVDAYAASANAEILEVFQTIGRSTNIYCIHHKGEALCLCRAPLGGSAAVQLLDFLLGHGVTQVIAAGPCGALAPLPENTFLLPAKALRDEGTSYHYLPPARFAETNPKLRQILAQTLEENHLSWAECITWTTDGFFRETAQMVAYRREEGCSVVEMECASMAACAAFRGAAFAQLLYTADSLADAANYDARDWGEKSVLPALQLCLDTAAKL
jgi:uridine phosphorylase